MQIDSFSGLNKMFVTELAQQTSDVERPDRCAKPAVILSAEQFQDVLQHERLRADRSQLPFCMIAMDFDVEPTEFQVGVLDAIGCRVRATDVIGWLLDGRLGVITPYTPGHGAQLLAHDLVSLTGSSDLEGFVEHDAGFGRLFEV